MLATVLINIALDAIKANAAISGNTLAVKLIDNIKADVPHLINHDEDLGTVLMDILGFKTSAAENAKPAKQEVSPA